MAQSPEVSLSEFKKLNSEQIKELKSCEITSDGEYLCTVITPPKQAGMSIYDNLRTQADYLGARGNTVGGKFLKDIKKNAPV